MTEHSILDTILKALHSIYAYASGHLYKQLSFSSTSYLGGHTQTYVCMNENKNAHSKNDLSQLGNKTEIPIGYKDETAFLKLLASTA